MIRTMNLQYWQKLWNVCYLIFMLVHNRVLFLLYKCNTLKDRQYLCSSAKYEHKH